MTRAGHWDDIYRTTPETKISWYDPDATQSLALFDALGIGHEAAVVDVGGGAARLVDLLLDRGFEDLTVLDISQQALDVARSRLGSKADTVDWITSDLLEWRPQRPYDVWHDRAVLHFLVRPGDRARYRSTLESAIPVGGHVIIATFALDGPDHCSGLPVVRYDDRALCEALGPEFELVHSRRRDHRTPTGTLQSFTWAGFVRTGSGSAASMPH